MQSWLVVRLQMLAWGYSRVLTIELACLTRGTWRGELPEEQDWYTCPVCSRPAKATFTTEGYTRRTVITEWRQIAVPLTRRQREMLLHEDFGEDMAFHRQQRRQRFENDKITRKVLKRGRGLEGKPSDLRSGVR